MATEATPTGVCMSSGAAWCDRLKDPRHFCHHSRSSCHTESVHPDTNPCSGILLRLE